MIGTLLFFSGLVLPILLRRRWLNDLLIPGNFGRWLLASGYLVFPVLLYFIGFSIEQERLPSGRGLLTIAGILVGIWLLTGLPTIFLGVPRSIRSWKTRKIFARTHHLRFLPALVIEDLFPKKLSWFNPRLTNVLEVVPGTLIASALHKTVRRGTRGMDLILIEGTARYATFMAYNSGMPPDRIRELQKRQGRASDPFADSRIIVNDTGFLTIASDRISDLGKPLDEADAAFATSREVVESVLHRIAEQGPDMFSQVNGVYLHDGRMLILLNNLLDKETQLSRWVSFCPTIKSRPRVRHGG